MLIGVEIVANQRHLPTIAVTWIQHNCHFDCPVGFAVIGMQVSLSNWIGWGVGFEHSFHASHEFGSASCSGGITQYSVFRLIIPFFLPL
jgi:hypothetical protein